VNDIAATLREEAIKSLQVRLEQTVGDLERQSLTRSIARLHQIADDTLLDFHDLGIAAAEAVVDAMRHSLQLELNTGELSHENF
jgi:hypothetical protein